MTICTIVDTNDNVVGYKPSAELTRGDIYRVSAVWLKNTSGDILLAQRALTKKNDPGCWGPASSGTVEQGETYESNAYKEAEEELGLRDVPLEVSARLYVPENGYGNGYMCQFFIATVDWPTKAFTFPKEEVAAIHWFTADELRTTLRTSPEKFTAKFADGYHAIAKHKSM